MHVVSVAPAKARRVGGVACVSIVLLSGGCSTILGVDDYRTAQPGDGSTPASPIVSICGDFGNFNVASADCRACTDSHCCDEERACSLDPTCRAYMRCLAGCAPRDAKCRSDCSASIAFPFRSVEVGLLQRCQTEKHCDAACGLSCGVFSLARGSTACEACMQTKCCSEQLNVTHDVEAVRLDACRQNCDVEPPDACDDACNADHPSAVAEFDGAVACFQERCQTECAKPVWSCLGHVEWPVPAVNHADFRLYAFNTVTNLPLPKLTVAVCPSDSTPCDPLPDGGWPIPSEVTDDSGFTKPIGLGLSFGAQAFTGYFDVRGPNINDSISYPDTPVIRSLSLRRAFIPKQAVDAVEAQQSISRDPSDPRGNIWMSVADCLDHVVAGVRISSSSPEVDAKSVVVYDPAGDPTLRQTPANGLAAILNVRPGRITIDATIVDSDPPSMNGRQMATWHVWVRPNSDTLLTVRPRP